MNLRTFIKNNRQDWEELEITLRELSKKTVKPTPELLDKFQRLYQKANQHLSFSQTYFPKEELTSYLNNLVLKAHNTLYRDQITSLQQIRQFFGTTFVRLLSEQWKFILLASLLFLLGAVGSFLSVMNDQLNIYFLLPPEIAYAVDPEQIGGTVQSSDSPLFSSEIMINNLRVALLAFAGGTTFGGLTIYMLIYNGVIMGALAALFLQHDKFYEFWAYIVPHGMIELTAIFIAGGAGLLMGYHLLIPGPYSRSFHLKRQALRSVQLLLGTIPLFIIAGIIEGYITPAPISLEIKYLFAILTVFGLIIYVWLGRQFGKRTDESILSPD